MGSEIDRMRQTLGGIEAVPFRGDNLAIFLASEFEPDIEDEELDETGTWKQGAIDAANKVLDAIHDHYAPLLQSLAAENAGLKRERDELQDELDEAKQPIWPKWATSIVNQLQSYGVEIDPFDGWDLPVDLDDWLSEAVRIETEKLLTRAESADAALREARGHIDQLVGLLVVIKEHWIDYDHVFSTSVHDARHFLESHGGGE